MGWITFRSEGGLLPPDVLDAVVAGTYGGQGPRDFGIARRSLIEEINAAWGEARTHWASFQMAHSRLDPTESTTTITREWMVRLLRVLGFRLVYQDRAARTDDGQTYAISHRLETDTGLPVHLVGAGTVLTQRHRGLMRLSPYATVQEYLNKTEYLWGIVSNGERLWILRNSTRTARPTYLEWDLATMMEAEKYEDFLAFYRLCHVSRFPKTPEDGPTAWIERYTRAATEQGGRIRERLREGVEAALTTLGAGFLAHPANHALREAVQHGSLTADAFYQELLRLIYRLLFLMVAEERQMLIPPNDAETAAIYQAAYSLERLRRLAGEPPQRITPGMHDLWRGLLDTFDLLAHHETSGPLPVPPLNGDLFSPEALPHIRHAVLDNAVLLEAVRPLAWFTQEGVRRWINYAALDVEELGSVYESLLDFAPRFAGSGDRWTFQLAAGSERKSTGSYYTRPELVQHLIQTALAPVVTERLRTAEPGREADTLLSLAICDPACGSGHFLLAAGRYVARVLAQVRSGEAEPAAEAYQHALRDVIQHCLYGVDKNPLAVELCKVALWIEGHEVGRPLSFLDHRIRCGDSLVGLVDLAVLKEGIPSAAYTPKTGDSKTTAQALKRQNRVEQQGVQRWSEIWDAAAPTQAAQDHVVDDYRAVDALPSDRADQVQAKKRQYAAWREPHTPWYALWTQANLWVAPFFASLTPEHQGQVPTSRHVHDAWQGQAVSESVQAYANALAQTYQFFHWPLEFPDVFARGGFDVIVGNPPWGRIKLLEETWFQGRDSAVARAANKTERARRIAALATTNPDLWAAFRAAQHGAEAASLFVRESGRYPLTGVGDVNTYALFAELGYTLLHDRGMLGLVLPTGIATDYTYRGFFAELVQRQGLVSLYDFENREKLFSVDSRRKFSLMTLSRRAVTNARFGFFLTRADQVHDPIRTFTLTAADLLRVNPNTGTCPVFRTRQDAELTHKLYARVPVLVNDRTGENPWGIRFVRMFDMSNDSGLFYSKPGPDRVPLYEGKMVGMYDHRAASVVFRSANRIRQNQPEITTVEQYLDPWYEPTPLWWVDKNEVDRRLENYAYNWVIGFKDVTSATNARTAIFMILPWAGIGHKIPLLFSRLSPSFAAALLANFNSIICDYLARQKVGGNSLGYFILEQLPVLPPTSYNSDDLELITNRVLELSYTSWSLQPFAHDMGYDGPPFPWDSERRAHLRAELDAYYALLYGLTREELQYIVDPQSVMGPDFPGETFRVLKENELRAYGEYRTARLVLDAYDRLAPSWVQRVQPTG